VKDAPWILVAPGTLEVGKKLALDPTETRHVTGPLRRRHGDRVVLIDGEGRVAEAELQTARGRDIKAVVLSSRFEGPLIAERTQAPHRTIIKRAPHWRRVARQSLKQCKRVWAMDVPDPRTVDQIIEQCPPGSGGVAHREGVPFHQVRGTTLELLLVGPEGGFTPGELELLVDREWPLIRFGVHVLRAETAAVVGAALLIARREENSV
jgi:16S rRNA U1498 N3-methylase RsmE